MKYWIFLTDKDFAFLKEDGIPYIEVHHIIPLCRGAEDYGICLCYVLIITEWLILRILGHVYDWKMNC